MDMVIVVIVLVALAGLVFYLRRRNEGQATADEGQRRLSGSGADALPQRQQVTLDNLHPGDAVVFWDGSDALVETVLECREQVGARTVSWQWIVLDNGWVIEVSADGRFLYTESAVFLQGSWEFEHLTGDVEHDGVLKTFEERVQEGRSAREPVYFVYQDVTYQVQNTGTFTATGRSGQAPTRQVWRDISPDPGDNVYAGLSAEDDTYGLCVWTTHMLFLHGRELQDADLRGLYGA